MSKQNYLKNIAIVGASGNVGSAALTELLATNRFNITIISRPDSTATFPASPSLTVLKGSYTDPDFLSTAFQNQDAVLFTLSFTATGIQPTLIRAAASAGVRWILPNEFACDGANEAMVARVPLFHPKRDARDLIASLSTPAGEKVHYIALATNPWTGFSLAHGMFGIDVAGRKATLYDGAGSFNTTTLEQVGRAIAGVLSLPVVGDERDPDRCLMRYADSYVYVSSFRTSQRELFDAVLRETGTAETEWEVSRSSIDKWIEDGKEAMKKGDMFGAVGMTYGVYMGEGMGGDYEEKAKKDREVLGLKEERVADVVKAAIA